MRDSLVVRGVPADIMYLDGTGFSTVNSIQNTRDIFNEKEITIISQRFHNERAIVLAVACDIDAIGYNATSPNMRLGLKVYFREIFARVKLFWDVLWA